MDLRRLPNLHIFTINVFVSCYIHAPVVLRDINPILRTIPKANQVTQLTLRFNFYGDHPIHGCCEQDWAGMCDEIVRISAGKQLELYLEMFIDSSRPGGDGLSEYIKDKMASLSDYSNIRTHLDVSVCFSPGSC